MSKCVFRVNIRIVINEILIASIVRRVDVDYIHFSRVCVRKLRQCSEVVALDYEVIRSVGVI